MTPSPAKRLEPVDKAEFRAVWQTVVALQQRKLALINSPIGKSVAIRDGREVRTITLLDSPLLRIIAGVRQAVGPERPEKVMSVAMRLMGLMHLVRSGSLEKFVARSAEGVMLPEVLLDVAAELPCSPRGFNAKKFMKVLRERVGPRTKVR